MKVRDIAWHSTPAGTASGHVGEVVAFVLHRSERRGGDARVLRSYLTPGPAMFTDVADEVEGRAVAGRMLAEFVAQFVEEG